jgi:hypothetical protein
MMYDGMATATGTAVVAEGSPRLIGSDILSGGSFTFTDVNAGTNKTVIVSNVTVRDGNNGDNYAISYVNNTSSAITPYVVSLTGGRVYDATTQVAASALTTGTLVGVVTLGLTGAGTLGDKNVGLDKLIWHGFDHWFKQALLVQLCECACKHVMLIYIGSNFTLVQTSPPCPAL